jgi:Transposase, Mutator family
VEEALVEMHLAGVSVRRVEDITEALWGTRVSPSTVSELNQRSGATGRLKLGGRRDRRDAVLLHVSAGPLAVSADE